jgi:molybdopterin-synthase adenylyltransferase
MSLLSDEEYDQYCRQILIDSISTSGQEKLKKARVFVAGAGGLGSSVLYYLAAAGIGEIFICDFDIVGASNLNRQILHDHASIGRLKVESAQQKLTALNPYITIHQISEALTTQTADRVIPDVDIIVDCLDNFETRMILNDYAIQKRIPLVYAGVEGLTGQVSYLNPPETPCFYCVFQGYTPMGEIPVLGATVGVVGSLQAFEVIKSIVGTGDLLKNKILVFDGVLGRITHVSISRLPDCPHCS